MYLNEPPVRWKVRNTKLSDTRIVLTELGHILVARWFYSFPEYLYDVPTGVTVILSICYGSISVLAIVGNSLVMWVVTTTRRMQNMTNFFIANLALADIIIGLFVIPFQVINIFHLCIR